MKKRRFALAMAFVLALALTGCSANRDGDVNPADSANNGIGSTSSPDAGGTNDLDNDGLPEGSGDSQSRSNNGGNVMDDIGDAAGDLARGAGNAVRDAGDAIGDAANDVGRAMR